MNVGGPVALEADAPSVALLKEFAPGIRGKAVDFGSKMHVDSPRLSFEIASGILTDADGNQRPASAPEKELFNRLSEIEVRSANLCIDIDVIRRIAKGEFQPTTEVLSDSINARDEVAALRRERDELEGIREEVHSWIVCAAIASPEDMMQNAGRISEISKPLDSGLGSRGVSQRSLPYNEGSFNFECKHQSSAEDLHAAVGGYLLQQGGQFLVCSTDVAKKLRTPNQLAALGDGNFSELIRIEDLEPLPGKYLPKDFKDAVRLLTRPYIEISEAQYQQVMKMTENPLTDIVRLKDGRQATFGEADGGYALMPLTEPI